MFGALIPRPSSPFSSPGWGHCVVFLGKTLYSHSTSLYPGVSVGARKFNAGGNFVLDWHPIEQGVEILLVTSCYRNWDKLWPDGSLLARMQTLPLCVFRTKCHYLLPSRYLLKLHLKKKY